MTAHSVSLFSYGTLQLEEVQRSSFGRLLTGSKDALPGFRKELVEITDPDVLTTSGQKYHPIVMRSDNPRDAVPGHVFQITEEELAQADAYEVDDYQRIEVTLASGQLAWVYVKAD